MNHELIRDNFNTLRVWKRKGSIAPHKPLLILLAIKYLLNGKRWIEFKDLEKELEKLLNDFSPESKFAHPEYPFWRLQTDGIWEVHPKDFFEPNRSGDVSAKQLLQYKAYGGFKDYIANTFIKDSSFALEIAQQILDKYFEWQERQVLIEKFGWQAFIE